MTETSPAMRLDIAEHTPDPFDKIREHRKDSTSELRSSWTSCAFQVTRLHALPRLKGHTAARTRDGLLPDDRKIA